MPEIDDLMQTLAGPGYHPLTRWLHAGLVLGVTFQLVCAVLMASPDHKGNKFAGHASSHSVVAAEMTRINHQGGNTGQLFLQAHRTGGILVAMVVLANLIWAVLRRGKPRKRQLSVLLSRRHWREALSIARNIPWILWGKKPLPELGNSLSLVFEMLGLLTMGMMGVTGAIIWFLWAGPGHDVSRQAEWLMQTHAFVAPLLLLYLTGHITMAAMHARGGDPVFARIRPRVTSDDARKEAENA